MYAIRSYYGLGVVPDLAGSSVYEAVLHRQVVDHVGVALVQVDGAGMGLGEDPVLVDRAHHLAVGIDDRA